ncbi:MAG: hypothetical protein AAGE65_08525 [Planctomycetota bacterium]
MSRRSPHRFAASVFTLGLGLTLLIPNGWCGPAAVAQPPDEAGPEIRGPQPGDRTIRERIRERRERFARERGLDEAQLAERRARVLAVLEDLDPALAERFRNAPDDRPGVKMALLEDRFPEVLRLVRLREHDQDLYALRVRELVLSRQMRDVARQIRLAERQEQRGEDPVVDADDLRRDLEDLAEEQFEAEQAAEELQLQRFEERLEMMRERFKQRDRDERQIIQRTIERLLSGDPRRTGSPERRGPGGLDGDRPERPGPPRREPPRGDELDL